VYALQDGIHNPTRVETKVSSYLREVREVQPEGPYFLIGECSGAILALEMAQQLSAQEEKVALLALLEPTAPSTPGLRAAYNMGRFIWDRVKRRFRHHTRSVTQLTTAEQGVYVRFRWLAMANRWALSRYSPKPYAGRIDLFLAADSLQAAYQPRTEWRGYALGGFVVHELPGTRATIIGADRVSRTEDQVQALAEQLQTCIGEVA
jgi:thioesterase domain-containing protein